MQTPQSAINKQTEPRKTPMTIKPVLVPDHTATDLRELMNHFAEAATAPVKKQLTESVEPGVAEARPDVMRHKGDKTIKIVKKAGKPIGEIGIDAEASEGNGPYYVKLYDGSYDAVGFDTAEEALEELKSAIKSMSEGVSNADEDPNLAKAYRMGNEAYKAYKTDPTRAQAAQDKIEAEFPQYLKMWTTGYQDGERFDQEKNIKEQAVAAFKPGDRVMYLNGFATVVAQDGDAYGIRIDGKPGTLKVPASQIRKPSYDESVTESIDPVEQLRADILRFSR